MEYNTLAQSILMDVGGEENVISLEHCATRLRFNLKDTGIANTAHLEQTNGVVSVVHKGGQYQVVIGNEVIEVYQELMKLASFQNHSIDVPLEKKGRINNILDTIAGIFVPVVPALAGAGMLKALLSLLTVCKLVENTSVTYQFLNFMGDTIFYFMPVILAGSAAKKFKVNMFVAITIGAMLIHPTFLTLVANAKEAGTSISVFGLPVSLVTYSSSVIPVILAIWLMSYVEPLTDRIMPKAIRLFMTPLITMLVVGLATFVVLGPLGMICGNFIGDFIQMLNHYASWLVPLLVGTFTPLLVMTGMHYGLIPIGINMLATTGFDTVAGPGMMVSNIAQGGAALAVAIKTKNKNIRSLAVSSGISAVCGITEPAMYGISLRFKKPLIAAMCGGGAAGLFLGIMGVGRYVQVAPGLFALPSFIGGDGMANFTYALIGCMIAFVVSFIISFLLGITDPKDEVVQILNDEVVCAMATGKVIALQEVKDPAFSQETLGKGIAIYPTDGAVFAPINGVVSVCFETGHAVGITSDDGVHILIHIGLDTVELKGKYFRPLVIQGQRIKQGEPLVNFDKDALEREGYDLTTMMIVTNTLEYQKVEVLNCEKIQAGDPLIKLEKKGSI